MTEKPYPDFPLFAHARGYWAKKILGRLRYFGRIEDGWQAALERFEDEREALYAGREPGDFNRGLVVGVACDEFLSSKLRAVQDGELSQKTYDDYYKTCETLAKHFGKSRSVESLRAGDFEDLRSKLADRFSSVRLAREITQVKMVFRYCYEAGHMETPARFGPRFKGPKRREIRLAQAKNGLRFFEAIEIDALVKAARSPIRAMVLLGINCGFGNHDCGLLEFGHLDLDRGWHFMPRPKTGIERRAKLWPETIEAIREAIDRRPNENGDSRLVFLTKYRQPWYKETSHDNPLSNEFRKLLDATGLYRRGRTFYALRHTFETIGGESRDQVAVDHIMGHLRDDMASIYREKISDARLEAVSETVRKWRAGVLAGVQSDLDGSSEPNVKTEEKNT